MQNNFYTYFFISISVLNLLSFIIVLTSGYDNKVLACVAVPFFISLFLGVILGKEWQGSSSYNIKKLIFGSAFFFIANSLASIFLFNMDITISLIGNFIISILIGFVNYFIYIYPKSRRSSKIKK